MTERLKRMFALLTVTFMASQFFLSQVQTSFAANPGSVVINEIAWAGSLDGSNDEWIELYNTTDQAIDLTDWVIEDDGNPNYLIPAGVIAPRSFFLIEDHQDAVSNIEADAVIGLSLANSGDSLVLKDSAGLVIDTVNGDGGAWYAGNGDNKASMERADPDLNEDDSDNWDIATSDNIGLGRSGSMITGTPKAINSNFAGATTELTFHFEDHAEEDQTIEVEIRTNDVEDLYAYSLDITYNPNVLAFSSAVNSEILASDNANTFFQAALENGQESKLIVASSRLLNPAEGVDVNGTLFTLTFDVIGEAGDSSSLDFSNQSYLADSTGDIPVRFNQKDLVLAGGEQNGNVEEPRNFSIENAEERYALSLSWEEPVGGADSYIIQRQMVNGQYVEIGNTEELSFIDNQELLVNIDYNYRLIAVLNGENSQFVEAIGREERGLEGDLDRSDRVDGKDVELLARTYGSEHGQESYQLMNDLNFDGIIDGNDLITIGANFGLTY